MGDMLDNHDLVRQVAIMEERMNASTYRSVWDGLLEVARAREYYYAQEKSLQARVSALRVALALCGCGTVVSLLAPLSWLGPVSGAGVASLVIFDFHWGGTKLLSQIQTVNVLLQRMDTDYRSLWDRVRSDDIKGLDIHSEKQILMKRLDDITAIVDIKPNEKVRYEAQKAAFETEAARYAT